MKCIKIFLLILISLLMIVTGWVYLSFMSIEQTLLNEDYYEDFIIETDMVNRAYDELQDSFLDIVIANIFDSMDQEELSVFKKEEKLYLYALNSFLDVIEPAWIEKQLNQNVKGILAFVRGDQEDLVIVINMDEIEDNFRQKVVSEILDLPIAQIKELGDHTHPAIVEARVARIIRGLGFFKPVRLTQLHHNIPNEVENVLIIYQNYKSSVYYIAYIFFGAAFVIMILLAKPAKGFIWFGGTTIVFSLSFLLGLQLLKNYFPGLLLSGIHDSGLLLSAELIQSIVFYVAESINYIAIIAVTVGLVFLLIGLMWVFIIRKNNSTLSADKVQND